MSPLPPARLYAVLRGPDPKRTAEAGRILVAAGVDAIEVTFTVPEAEKVIAELVADVAGRAVVAAGTIRTPDQARQAADAGAQVLVSPGDPGGLTEAMTRTGLPACVGALTPSEVMRAVDAGADAVKLFPSSLGGVAYLAALRGPFPDVPFLPTGGVTADNVADWFAAGAFAVGAGSDLCSAADIAAGHWDRIRAKAARFVAALPPV